MANNQMISGELLVAGKDEIEIELQHGRPDAVIVEFRKHPQHIPCNPQQDRLEWEIHHRHGKFVLLIKWNVVGTREVIWVVSF